MNEVRHAHDESDNDFMRKFMYYNHVILVQSHSALIAQKVGANPELTQLAALFHDIARCYGKKEDPELMDDSIKIAVARMKHHGYSKEEIENVKEAILNHSCRLGIVSKSLEGKAMAAGDALAHLCSDFYIEVYEYLDVPQENYKDWGLAKIDRDYYQKIFWKDIQVSAEPHYRYWKDYFKSLK